MKRICIVAASAAALVLAAGPSPASAAPKAKEKPSAQVLGVVSITGTGTATVRARYSCEGGQHLWVSAKQAPSLTRDPILEQEGSSAKSAAWLQSHPVTFTCDGRKRTQTFTIDTLEQGFGSLKKGAVYVQFCLIGQNFFLSENKWAQAR